MAFICRKVCNDRTPRQWRSSSKLCGAKLLNGRCSVVAVIHDTATGRHSVHAPGIAALSSSAPDRPSIPSAVAQSDAGAERLGQTELIKHHGACPCVRDQACSHSCKGPSCPARPSPHCVASTFEPRQLAQALLHTLRSVKRQCIFTRSGCRNCSAAKPPAAAVRRCCKQLATCWVQVFLCSAV